MATTTLQMNQRTEDAVEKIKSITGATTKAEVIRKAIALLEAAAKASSENGEIVIRTADGTEQKIIMN